MNDGRIPGRYQEELVGSVNAIVESIPLCAPPGEDDDGDEDDEHEDDDEGRGKGKGKGKGKKGRKR